MALFGPRTQAHTQHNKRYVRTNEITGEQSGDKQSDGLYLKLNPKRKWPNSSKWMLWMRKEGTNLSEWVSEHIIHRILELVCTLLLTALQARPWHFGGAFTLFTDNGFGTMHGYHIKTVKTLVHRPKYPHLINDHFNSPLSSIQLWWFVPFCGILFLLFASELISAVNPFAYSGKFFLSSVRHFVFLFVS